MIVSSSALVQVSLGVGKINFFTFIKDSFLADLIEKGYLKTPF